MSERWLNIGEAAVMVLALVGIAIILTACGEWPEEARQRQQRADTLQWLVEQETDRARRCPAPALPDKGDGA